MSERAVGPRSLSYAISVSLAAVNIFVLIRGLGGIDGPGVLHSPMRTSMLICLDVA